MYLQTIQDIRVFRKSNNIDILIDFKYYQPVNDPRDPAESRKYSVLSTL